MKHGRKAAEYPHPVMKEVLEETHGVMVYQEQVMRIINRLGGIELSNAYTCIKAISKKKLPIDRQVPRGVRRRRRGRRASSKTKAAELFGMIEKFAGYGFNKCVVGATTVINADTGERVTAASLFKDRPAIRVHSLGTDGKLRPRAVKDVVWNGRKPVYSLRTAQGKSIRATANHPLLTFDGWKCLADLRPGDRIATPRRLDVLVDGSWRRHEIIALAGLLSEGNSCHPSCLYFYNNDRVLIDDFAEAVQSFANTKARVGVRRIGHYEVCVSTGTDTRFRKGQTPWNASSRCETALLEAPPDTRCGAYRWAEGLGLLNRAPKRNAFRPPLFACPTKTWNCFSAVFGQATASWEAHARFPIMLRRRNNLLATCNCCCCDWESSAACIAKRCDTGIVASRGNVPDLQSIYWVTTPTTLSADASVHTLSAARRS